MVNLDQKNRARTRLSSRAHATCVYINGESVGRHQKLKGKTETESLFNYVRVSATPSTLSVSVDDRVLLWILRRSRAAVFHERMMRISIQPYNI